MKKTLVCMIVLAMMLGVMLIPAAAAENEILKSTPYVDGKLDSVYAQSWSTTVDTSSPKLLVTNDYADTAASATVYALHDADYLYLCAVVTGDTSVVNNELKNWATDGLDIWLSTSLIPDKGPSTKIPMTAYGTTLEGWNAGTDNKLKVDLAQVKMAATQNEDGYVVEAAVPLTTLAYDESGNTVMIAVQLNNISEVNENGGNADKNAGFYGYQYNNGTVLTLSDTAVTWDKCGNTDYDGLHSVSCNATADQLGKCTWCGKSGLPAEAFQSVHHWYSGAQFYAHPEWEYNETQHQATRTCEFCEEVVVEEWRDHVFNDGVCECGAEEVSAPAFEPCTATEDGLHIGICDTEGKCGWCGKEGIPAEGFSRVDHKYTGDDEYYQRPTWESSAEGHIATRHCEYCDETVVEELREHNFVDGVCECGYEEPTDAPNDDESAKTGDITVSVLAGMMALAAVGAAVVIKKRG